MLDRIEASVSRITQFTADASHELRTPVSLIRTEAELSLRRARSQNEYQDSLRHILLEAERTTALIEQLLSVARADLGGETLQLQPVDLSTMLQGVAEAWKQVAAIRDLRFSTNLPHSDASVAGDENLLRRVADILLDNAFKYTPGPGSVSLSLEAREHFATITIQDSGIGIPQAEQVKIFERTRALHCAVDNNPAPRYGSRRKPSGRGHHISRGTANHRDASAQSATRMSAVQNGDGYRCRRQSLKGAEGSTPPLAAAGRISYWLYFASLTIASAALPATIQLADPATTASSSNHRNPKLSMHSGKSGLMMMYPGITAPGM